MMMINDGSMKLSSIHDYVRMGAVRGQNGKNWSHDEI